MASTSDIRKGLCIRFNNDIYKIIDFLHVKPGKGPAFVRTKLKALPVVKLLIIPFLQVIKLMLFVLKHVNFSFYTMMEKHIIL